MSVANLDGRRNNSRSRRLNSAPTIREEDKSSIKESFGEDNSCPPRTAVIRRTETRSIKTNQTTGLKVAELSKNLSRMASVRQNLVTQKEYMKLGSGRLITSRRQGDRHFHGIRHFQELLHCKIRDLYSEIENLDQRSNEARQEYINSVSYEAKARELASNITNLQETLAELNLSFDHANRNGDIEELVWEFQNLEELNNSERVKIEELFHERKLKEDIVHQIENNEQVKKIMISHIDRSAENEQYIYFNERLSQSSKAINFWEKQMEHYGNIKDTLTQKLKQILPFVDDVISLEIKLKNLTKNLNEVNKNSPFQFNTDHEMILKRVKQDKLEITEMENNLKSMDIQINSLNEIIDYLKSTEGEPPNGEETIDVFLSSFDYEKDNEIKKFNALKPRITHYLSELAIKLSSIPSANDYIDLHYNKTGEAEISHSLDYKEQYCNIVKYIKKLELMEIYHRKACKYLDEKWNELKHGLEEYESQKGIIDNFEIREIKLSNQVSGLKEDNKTHLKEQELAKARLDKLEKEISLNEKHKELLALEKKVTCMEEDKLLTTQAINDLKIAAAYLLEIKEQTLHLMCLINAELLNQYE